MDSFKYIPRDTGFTDLISIAKEVVKRDAYEYVTSNLDSDRMINNFEEFLFEETDNRYGLWAFIVDGMVRYKDNVEGMQIPLGVLLRFASRAIEFNALFHEFFEECIHIILSLEELEAYHAIVEKLWDNYLAAMETGDERVDMEFLVQDTGIDL